MHSLIEVSGYESHYFTDTDTLYIEFQNGHITETREMDENTLLDLDADGNVCAITFEHGSVGGSLLRGSDGVSGADSASV